MKILVSVRSVDEALLVAHAGVDFIDLKEPSQGALGGLPVATISSVMVSLRRERPQAVVSATIGDWPVEALPAITRQIQNVAACGVDYVKVGIPPGPGALALVQHLTHLQRDGLALVPVLIADQGVPAELVQCAAQGGFAAVMLDTQDKRAGSLLDLLGTECLAHFVAQVRVGGAMAGLSGALQRRHAAAIAALAPDFAGFRSAVCATGREGTLDPARLDSLLREWARAGSADALPLASC